jgi:ORF6N domain
MPTRPAAQNLISTATIERQILVLRGHRVMLDRDLAEIYGVKLKRLNEQVKRNRGRFPDDFMFQLTLEEGKLVILSRSQIATLKRGENVKYRPHVFTEHGAVMLANVLRSPVAVRASIQVVRAFVNLQRMLATHEDLARKVEAIERRVGKHDGELQDVLRILRTLLEPPPVPPKRRIGFVPLAKAK